MEAVNQEREERKAAARLAAGGGSQEAGNEDDVHDDDMQSVESNYEYDDGSDDEVQESTQGKVRGLDPHPLPVFSPPHRTSTPKCPGEPSL